MRPFRPIIPSSHLITIAGNFWPRDLDTERYPVESKLYQTEPGVEVLVQSQRPAGAPLAELILAHGLEGSGESGYMKSLSQAALDAGFAVHRFHMRSCGGTAHLCPTLYHAGLTSDLLSVIRQFTARGAAPIFLVGFSLGGNVVLKLAGELGGEAAGLIAGVCASCVPIDLAASARRLGQLDNRVYERRFVRRMKNRMLATGRYTERDFIGVRSIFAIDDRMTAPSFGFRDAMHYYETQSANRFLDAIRVPTLVVQAKDDTFIPFEIFRIPVFESNPCLTLLAPERGGHLGFLSRRKPRFWLDEIIVGWTQRQLGLSSNAGSERG